MFGCWMLDVGVSSIEHPTSNIQHRTSNIEHPTSNIQHRTSNIQHPTSSLYVLPAIHFYDFTGDVPGFV